MALITTLKNNRIQLKWQLTVLLFGTFLLTPFITQAEKISFGLKTPKRVSDSRFLYRSTKKLLRMELLRHNFRIKSKVRNGFHLRIAMSIEESTFSYEPASCTIQLHMRTIAKPQNVAVLTSSSSGRSNFTRASKLSLSQKRELRSIALKYAIRGLIQFFRRNIHKIKANLKEARHTPAPRSKSRKKVARIKKKSGKKRTFTRRESQKGNKKPLLKKTLPPQKNRGKRRHPKAPYSFLKMVPARFSMIHNAPPAK